MLTAIKLSTLAFYLVALLGFAEVLPASPVLHYAQLLCLATLVVHAFEAIFMIQKVRLYRGPLAVSLLLTLLFGGIHLYEVVAAARAASKPPA